MLSVVDPEQHSYNRAIYDHRANEGSLANFERTGRMNRVYYPILVNAQVNLYKDKDDLLSGVVSMTCYGDSEGGNAVVPVLGKQYQMRNEDILLLRTPLLDRWISPYDGPSTPSFTRSQSIRATLRPQPPLKLQERGRRKHRIRTKTRAKDVTD